MFSGFMFSVAPRILEELSALFIFACTSVELLTIHQDFVHVLVAKQQQESWEVCGTIVSQNDSLTKWHVISIYLDKPQQILHNFLEVPS